MLISINCLEIIVKSEKMLSLLQARSILVKYYYLPKYLRNYMLDESCADFSMPSLYMTCFYLSVP